MKDSEMRAFSLMVSKSSDSELKQDLRSINRIEEKDLDLAVKLLRKILTDKGRREIVEKLVEDDLHHNCVGAVDPALILLQPQSIAELTYLWANNIKGTDLYTLWNDCSGRKPNMFILNIWALQSGVYLKSEIDENFRINHIDVDIDGRINNQDDKIWFDRANRAAVIPFIFEENIVNPGDYMKDLSKAEPHADDFKEFVRANRAYQRLKNYLCQSNLHTNGITSIKKNEISIGMVMPTLVGLQMIQDAGGEVEIFSVDANQILEVIADRPVKKHYDMVNCDDLMRVIYYLRYARKQFLPGLPVIRNLPIEEIPNFYANGNDKRFADLISKSGFESYEEQEGLFKLAYLLGLFSASGNDSQKAYNYLKDHCIGKITGEDFHKLYGGIVLKYGFKKDFSEFFMIHHCVNIHCFEDSMGVDKTGMIYINFEKILAFRSEKSIKTTTNRERLMPEDAISALNDVCCMLGFPEEFRSIVEVVAKYTSDKAEIEWGIQKLNEAVAITEGECVIPYVEDEADTNYKFRVIKKGDPEIIITGRKSNCCFHYAGVAGNSFEHAITSTNSTVVVFESSKSYVQGWVWYDSENEFLVIDNLEGVIERDTDDITLSTGLVDAVIRYADQTIMALNNRGFACKSVNLGANLNQLVKNTLEKYQSEGRIIKAREINVDYPTRYSLYTDAGKGQYVISNPELLKVHQAQN